jgi:hypothetical protein
MKLTTVLTWERLGFATRTETITKTKKFPKRYRPSWCFISMLENKKKVEVRIYLISSEKNEAKRALEWRATFNANPSEVRRIEVTTDQGERVFIFAVEGLRL